MICNRGKKIDKVRRMDLLSPSRRYNCIPANIDAIAAMANEMTTAGPAVDLATVPARTYTPTPRVEPIPKAVRSRVDKTLASLES